MEVPPPWPPVLSCTPKGYVPWTNHFFLMGSNLEYWIANMSLPFFRHLNFSPNDITTMNCIFRLFICYIFIAYRWYTLVCVGVCMSQVLDCADGQMARRYHCGSEWGAWYDHTTDCLFGLCFTACYMYNVSLQCGWISLPMFYVVVGSLMLSMAGTCDIWAKHQCLTWQEYRFHHRVGMYVECYMSWIFCVMFFVSASYDIFP